MIPLSEQLETLRSLIESLTRERDILSAQNVSLRVAGASVASVLRKYAERYHGAALVGTEAALKLWSELSPAP